MVLAGGMKLHQLTLSSEDAQLIATRGFQVEEICRAFGVPPFMIGHTEKTTSWGSGIEQMSIGFVKYTLQRHRSRSSKSSTTSCSRPRATSANLSQQVLSAATPRRVWGLPHRSGARRRAGLDETNEIRRLENLPADASFDNQPAHTPPQP